MILHTCTEPSSCHFAASEGEDRGADEVAAGAGTERQQGRHHTTPSSLFSFFFLLSLSPRRGRFTLVRSLVVSLSGEKARACDWMLAHSRNSDGKAEEWADR
jgi:hypothetical protein